MMILVDRLPGVKAIVAVGNEIVRWCCAVELLLQLWIASPVRVGSTVGYAMSPYIDLSLLTILDQDEPGLEVRDSEGEWMEVRTRPGALFVFLADYVQRWSNGLHRAARTGPARSAVGLPPMVIIK